MSTPRTPTTQAAKRLIGLDVRLGWGFPLEAALVEIEEEAREAMPTSSPVDWEEHRKRNGWPTPNHMRRTADALDALTVAKYGDVLRWVANVCDAALPPLRPAVLEDPDR